MGSHNTERSPRPGGSFFAQSVLLAKIKPTQRFHKENKMRILVTLIFSLMMFAPQSFAQKDDYSAINAKNCGLDAYY